MPHVLIVGGSIAAATAASTLRAEGWDGAVTVLGEEEHPPYSRVPLSKGVVAGLLPVEKTELPALPDDVELRVGQRAVALHERSHQVELADGSRTAYDELVIATGDVSATRAVRAVWCGPCGARVSAGSRARPPERGAAAPVVLPSPAPGGSCGTAPPGARAVAGGA